MEFISVCATGESFGDKARFKESVFKGYENRKIDLITFEKSVEEAFGESGKIALSECKKKLKVKQKAIAAIKKDTPDFDENDALAIMLYTYDNGVDGEKNPYRILNRILGERNDAGARKILPYTMYLLRALRKLGQYTTKKAVYRGINGNLLSKDSYKKDNYLSWQAFTSTTPETDAAKKFLDTLPEKDSVMFKISGPFHGYLVSKLSYVSDEKEVLLEPETVFRIVKILKPTDKRPYRQIEVEVQNTGVVLENVVKRFFEENDTAQSFETKIAISKDSRAFTLDCDAPQASYLATTFGAAPTAPVTVEDSLRNVMRLGATNTDTSAEELMESITNSYKGMSKDLVRSLGLDKERDRDAVLAVLAYTYDTTDESVPPAKILANVLTAKDPAALAAVSGYFYHLLAALRRIRPINRGTTLWRSVAPAEGLDLSVYTEGAKRMWPGFMSTTTEKDAAMRSINSNTDNDGKVAPGGVLFEISGDVRGYQISRLSKFTAESEVLLEPETVFTVLSCTRVCGGGEEGSSDYTHIKVRVESHPPILTDAVNGFVSACGLPAIVEKKALGTVSVTTFDGGVLNYEDTFTKLNGVDSRMRPLKSITEAIEAVVGAECAAKVIEACKGRLQELISSGVLKELGLTGEQALAILAYNYEFPEPEDNKKSIRACLSVVGLERNDRAVYNVRDFIVYVLSGLRKLGALDTTKPVYRGIDGAFINFSRYSDRNEIVWSTFSTATQDEGLALEYTANAKKPTIFEIRGPYRAYNIGKIIGDDDTIVLEVGSKFRVVALNDDPELVRVVLEAETGFYIGDKYTGVYNTLPSNYIVQFDMSNMRSYYVNTNTRVSVWEHPGFGASANNGGNPLTGSAGQNTFAKSGSPAPSSSPNPGMNFNNNNPYPGFGQAGQPMQGNSNLGRGFDNINKFCQNLPINNNTLNQPVNMAAHMGQQQFNGGFGQPMNNNGMGINMQMGQQQFNGGFGQPMNNNGMGMQMGQQQFNGGFGQPMNNNGMGINMQMAQQQFNNGFGQQQFNNGMGMQMGQQQFNGGFGQ